MTMHLTNHQKRTLEMVGMLWAGVERDPLSVSTALIGAGVRPAEIDLRINAVLEADRRIKRGLPPFKPSRLRQDPLLDFMADVEAQIDEEVKTHGSSAGLRRLLTKIRHRLMAREIKHNKHGRMAA